MQTDNTHTCMVQMLTQESPTVSGFQNTTLILSLDFISNALVIYAACTKSIKLKNLEAILNLYTHTFHIVIPYIFQH